MWTLASIATHLRGELAGDPARSVRRVAPLREAGPDDLSFFSHPRYQSDLVSTKACAVLVQAKHRELAEAPGRALILVSDPYLAMAQAAQLMHPAPRPLPGVHAQAFVDASAEIDPTASVGPGAVVEGHARIGARCVVEGQAYVGPEAQVGEESWLGAGCKVMARCQLGARVVLQPGAVIGSAGFGYAVDAQGHRHAIPQTGIVVLEDDVEVGANTTIDRATFGETRIGAGTKIDNLVQIAHNVVMGEHCVVVSQSGIAGSTTLGNQVIMGAQTGMVGHITVGSGVVLGARAALGSDTPERGVYSGAPAYPHRQWLRTQAILKELPALRQRLRKLETHIRIHLSGGDAPGDGEAA